MSCWSVRSYRYYHHLPKQPKHNNYCCCSWLPSRIRWWALVAKDTHTGVWESGGAKLIVARKYSPSDWLSECWRVRRVLWTWEGTEAIISCPQLWPLWSIMATGLTTHSHYWNCGMSVMGVTNHFLIEFKACAHKIRLMSDSLNRSMNLWVGKS